MNMKTISLCAIVLILSGNNLAADGIGEASLGLSKSSVFDTPDPSAFEYPDTKARYSEALPRAFHGAPPQVPHETDSMLPITRGDNSCLECHDRPDEIGVVEVKGGRPMDRGHYSVHGVEGEYEGWVLSGVRYNCNQCHVQQADVPPLVDNTFSNSE